MHQLARFSVTSRSTSPTNARRYRTVNLVLGHQGNRNDCNVMRMNTPMVGSQKKSEAG